MVRLEMAKGSKGKVAKVPSSKSSNKENASPNSVWEPDPYADDSQVMDYETLTLVPTKVKTCRLKKPSGRFQSAKSASPPLVVHRSPSIVDNNVPKVLEKPSAEPPKRKPSYKTTKLSSNHPQAISKKVSADVVTKPSTTTTTTITILTTATTTKPSTKRSSKDTSDSNMMPIHHNKVSTKEIIMVPEKALKTSSHSTARSKNTLVDEKKSKTRFTKTKITAVARSFAQHQVFISKDMLLLIARFLPGLELVRLSLSNTQIQGWLSDPNHRLWQVLCVAAYKKFRFPKRDDDSWKRRYLQSLAICEACDYYCISGGRGAVVACVWCSVQYCGFNPPPGHVRFPSTPSVKPVPPREVGMCYEKCWALCWRCNDLIVMQNAGGQMGAVCRSCCPPDRDVCDQCRETILLARTKPQWQTRRDEHKVARVLGLNDTSMGEFVMELEDDNRSVTSQYRYERPAPEESILETSTIFDPYF